LAPNEGVPGYRDIPTPRWDTDLPVDSGEATAFLELFYAENSVETPFEERLAEVLEEIDQTGTYTHTSAELTFGARVAWRNASRCIGRLYWRSLQVLDCRSATTSAEIYQHLVTHLHRATNGGNIRPVISIFASSRPARPFPRVWNDQLVRYAGYSTPEGRVVGDPRYVEFTEAVRRMGWSGSGDAFDILPLVIETPDEGPVLYDLPREAVAEVPLLHPELAWFAELGLRWHAVPAISNMRMEIGGVQYPLAPFNGWYMGTEIGARNLADLGRYNLLPEVAQRMGLDTSTETTLWRDKALVELNIAVLYSFGQAGMKITDHHTESQRFLTHLEREEKAGRHVPADWSWIVPPLSGGATPVFHRYYVEADQRPNFYLDAEARELGLRGCPDRTDTTVDRGPAPAAYRAGGERLRLRNAGRCLFSLG
jgi:nitric-oxide synthase